MSDTRLSRAERWLFPAWVAFATLNVALMYVVPGRETIPFHFVWISLSLVYGLQPWPLTRTYLVLAVVCVVTGAALLKHVQNDVIGWEETTEVPLMSMVFLAMVLHVRRRVKAECDARALADSEHSIHEAQRRFVRLASHELRTPVTVARGYAELIRGEYGKPQVGEDVDIVLDELDKLGRITQRLLTLAQIDEPSTLRLSDVDLDALLQRTLKRWRVTADRCWELTATAGHVVADPERLETALDSLLDNAVRYTEPGGRIRLSGTRERSSAVITISDDGIGIPVDERAFAFESFRAGPRRGGTGIGLAIVKAVMAAHGGTATLIETPDASTTIRLSLPVPTQPGPSLVGGRRADQLAV
jgi:two-component system OmpR family sensor kinase